MTRTYSFSAWLVAAISLLGSGCAGTEAPRPSSSEDECADAPGEECTCPDDSTSETVCIDGVSECSCDDDFAPAPRDAGKSTARSDAGQSKDGGAARDGGARADSGSSSTPARDGGSTVRTDAGSGEVPDPVEEPPVAEPPVVNPGEGPAPAIPPMPASCPEFRTGTATVAGLSGISLAVGPKKEGTGSLLFYWHGTGSSSSEATFMFPAAARNELLAEGGIIVAFQRSSGRGGDCSGTGTFSISDFDIADQIVACAVRNHGIDPRRIYTTGCSAGGLQAGCMASRRSSYIAAAVPNSGGIVFPQPIQDPKHIPAVMTMHGSAADTVIVTFSRTSATLGNQFLGAGGFVINCNHGGGHCAAPATLQTAGWRFMKDHPFGVSPEPYASGIPSGFPTYCKVLGK